MALGIGYGLPFLPHFGSGADPYKPLWNEALEGAKAAGATVEDEGGTCLVARGSEEYNAGLPATPSLLIVPQFYKAGNLYQDVPPFVAEDSTMRFTVSRNTTATRVNSSGLIESVASGVPRIDWLGQSCPALLVEPSAQNLALQSEAFDISPWSVQFSATVSANTAISPDGTQNADTINLAADNDSRVRQSITLNNLTTYTISCFYKNIALTAGQTFRMRFNHALFVATATIDLAAGTATYILTGTPGTGYSGTATGRVDNYGNGWYRVSLTFTTGSGVSFASGLFEAANNISGAARSFYAWGAQVEVGSVATTYIPTTSAAVSRAADVISASGALVSGLIGATEGTIYLEFQFNNVSNAGLISVESTNNQNRVLLANANTTCNVQVRAANSNVFTTGIGTLTVGQFYKVAIGYSSGNTKVYLNGSAVITNTWAFTFDAALSRISLGNYENNSSLVTNSRIRALALYTTRLSDSQLEQLTKP